MAFDLTLGLKGKTALVTGAAGGIGCKTVELLTAHGAFVVAEDINPRVLELEQDAVAALVGDVAEEDTAKRAVALAVERFGTLDILVNNAGKTLNKGILATSAADWDGIMAINARGNFLHSREALSVMTAQGGGVIVNVASVVSAVGMKELAAYAASKGAIAQLTKVIAVEFGGQGIRANAIGVGVVETDILRDIVEDSRATLASYGPLHQSVLEATPAEITEIMLTNTFGPIRLARHLLPFLATLGTLCFMSSHRASIGGNLEGGLELYRASKAGLNMLSRGICADIKDSGQTVLNIHPGWAATDMGTLSGTVSAEIDVETSVRGVADVVERHRGSGKQVFVDYQDQPLEW